MVCGITADFVCVEIHRTQMGAIRRTYPRFDEKNGVGTYRNRSYFVGFLRRKEAKYCVHSKLSYCAYHQVNKHSTVYTVAF